MFAHGGDGRWCTRRQRSCDILSQPRFRRYGVDTCCAAYCGFEDKIGRKEKLTFILFSSCSKCSLEVATRLDTGIQFFGTVTYDLSARMSSCKNGRVLFSRRLVKMALATYSTNVASSYAPIGKTSMKISPNNSQYNFIALKFTH